MSIINFPGSERINKILEIDNSVEESRIISDIHQAFISIGELSALIFSAISIRIYQDEILREEDNFRKVAAKILKSLRSNFHAPSMGTYLELAQYCVDLVQVGKSTGALKEMAKCFSDKYKLQSLSDVYNDLNQLEREGESEILSTKEIRIVKENKSMKMIEFFDLLKSSRNIDAHGQKMRDIIEDSDLTIDVAQWRKGLKRYISIFRPILENTYILKIITNITKIMDDSGNDIKIDWEITSYENGDKKTYPSKSELRESSQMEWIKPFYCEMKISEIGSNKSVNLFPAILIRDHSICYYKKERARGYEYYKMSDGKRIVLPEIKGKYNKILFDEYNKDNSQQIFFYKVQPVTNEANGIRANIPLEEDIFVGRKKIINKIFNEILEVPNENAIIYGIGGIGKTALMLYISNSMYYDESREKKLFNNIIWATAKLDYFEPNLDEKLSKGIKVDNLDDILTLILEFFEIKRISDNTLNEKKDFVIDLFKTETVLLIIDNLEAISKDDQQHIIKFLNECKIELKKFPSNFKVIITSRQELLSGFHQIDLGGLNSRESNMFMDELYKKYKDSGKSLNKEYKDSIFKSSNGIPIVIKHQFTLIYSGNMSVQVITQRYESAGAKLIEFSFGEILNLIKRNKIGKRTLLLLGLYGEPITAHQISKILKVDEENIYQIMRDLMTMQCIDKIAEHDEKYSYNPQIRFLLKKINSDYPEELIQVKSSIEEYFQSADYYALDKEEVLIINAFRQHLSNNEYFEGEEFLKEEINKKPNSIPLGYELALYLVERKKDPKYGAKILANLSHGMKDKYLGQKVLRLLAKAYHSMDPPQYEDAFGCYKSIENMQIDSDEIRLEIVEFYTGFALSLNISNEYDHFRKLLKKSRRGDLFSDAENIINLIAKDFRHDYVCYQYALIFREKREREKSIQYIQTAISIAKSKGIIPDHFVILRRLILG